MSVRTRSRFRLTLAPGAPPRLGRPRPGRRRGAVAVLTGLVVATAAHVGLALAGEGSYWVRDPAYADREAALDRAGRDRPVVVFLGTSRVGNGFAAGRVGTHPLVGHRATAYNFGVAASGPLTHRVYLERLLNAGHRPALLLLEVLPASVADLPDGPLEARFLDGARFRRKELDVLAGYGVPFGKLHRGWQATMTLSWAGFRDPLLGRVAPFALPPHRRHDDGRTGDRHGWHRIMEEVLTPEVLADSRDRTRREYGPLLRDLHPGGPAERAVRDTVTLARDHAVPVRLVMMPEAPWFRQLYSPTAGARLGLWIQALARDAGCPLTDAREWYGDAAFADGHHLLPGGAAAFTDRLTADVIAPHLMSQPGGHP